MSDLFTEGNVYQPLADRMRPQTLQQMVGRSHLLSLGKPLRQAIEAGKLHSMLFWGPPGTGKTTLARLIAKYSDAQFLSLSAVLSGVKDIRAAVEKAKQFSGIHKSQGSEFSVVIIPVLTQLFKMLYRNLIYTGLTRAKKLAVFVGTRRAMAMAVRQQDTALRQNVLELLLKGVG